MPPVLKTPDTIRTSLQVKKGEISDSSEKGLSQRDAKEIIGSLIPPLTS